ncbi:zinc-binding dehydrogenase [Microcoleus anatoxicus]|uniref:Zinc-binding dehydrogenase n=1 Tax=Microcoleus anatoxicus PTRS2 TaxID=2705321 RepID=A0ABU8YKV9_9CYAN
MQAVVFDRYGDIEVLEYREVEQPTIKPDELLVQVRASIESGQVEPIVDRTYSLEEVAAAHAYSETGRAVGKIAISIEKVSSQ